MCVPSAKWVDKNWSQNLGWCSGWGDAGEGCFGRERDSAQKMQASKSELTDALNKKYRVTLHRFYEPPCTSCRVRNFDVGVCCSLLGGENTRRFCGELVLWYLFYVSLNFELAILRGSSSSLHNSWRGQNSTTLEAAAAMRAAPTLPQTCMEVWGRHSCTGIAVASSKAHCLWWRG